MFHLIAMLAIDVFGFVLYSPIGCGLDGQKTFSENIGIERDVVFQYDFERSCFKQVLYFNSLCDYHFFRLCFGIVTTHNLCKVDRSSVDGAGTGSSHCFSQSCHEAVGNLLKCVVSFSLNNVEEASSSNFCVLHVYLLLSFFKAHHDVGTNPLLYVVVNNLLPSHETFISGLKHYICPRWCLLI